MQAGRMPKKASVVEGRQNAESIVNINKHEPVFQVSNVWASVANNTG